MFMYYIDTLREPLEQSLEYVRGLCIGDHWSITWARDNDEGSILWYLTEVNDKYPRLLELGDFVLDEPVQADTSNILFHGIVMRNYPMTIKRLCQLAPENSQCLYHWERDRNGVVNVRHLYTEIVYYPADLWRSKWTH